MKYYPVFLNIAGKPCLVVGGGSVGTRKVRTLLECGARVTVVSPEASPELIVLSHNGEITLKQRAYRTSDAAFAFLVIGATDDQALNRQVHADAENNARLCNIADQPGLCNFILPAIVTRGDLVLAVSTSGTSPAFAKHLRRRLEEQFGPEYQRLLELMGAVRARLLAEEHAPEAHKPLFERLIDSNLLEVLKNDDVTGVDAILAEVLGPQFTYHDLLAPAGPGSVIRPGAANPNGS